MSAMGFLRSLLVGRLNSLLREARGNEEGFDIVFEVFIIPQDR